MASWSSASSLRRLVTPGCCSGAVAGLAPFGPFYGREQVRALCAKALRDYVTIWHGYARWALLGVITTEATGNAHVYLITLLQGPSAFAPIAASSLLIRPINVAQSALADFERPQIAHRLAASDVRAVKETQKHFQFALATIWIATALAAVALFETNPTWVFTSSYDLRLLKTGAALWIVVAALKFIQIPPSTILGVAGEFKALATASIWSSDKHRHRKCLHYIVGGGLVDARHHGRRWSVSLLYVAPLQTLASSSCLKSDDG